MANTRTAQAPGHRELGLTDPDVLAPYPPTVLQRARPDRRWPKGGGSRGGHYTARELALHVQRIIEDKPYLTFFAA